MTKATIHSTGSYVPKRAIPNSYFNELLGEDVDTWLRNHVQIYERHWCDENESTADLCVAAANDAMQRGNVLPDEVDLLIIATDTPEYISPSTASKVQHILGMENAGVFDLNSACAGFVTALDVASKYIVADENYQCVMVIGAYAMSKYLDLKDKKTVNLFADGAGAFVLKASEEKGRGFLVSELRAQGQFSAYMGIYNGGTANPINSKSSKEKEQWIRFQKKIPNEINPQVWSEIILSLCEKINAKKHKLNPALAMAGDSDFSTNGFSGNGHTEITPQSVDKYFLTQININNIFETMDKLDLPRELAYTNMHYNGYIGSACIPLAFDEAVKKGVINRGDLVFFIGSGGGLAFAGAAFNY